MSQDLMKMIWRWTMCRKAGGYEVARDQKWSDQEEWSPHILSQWFAEIADAEAWIECDQQLCRTTMQMTFEKVGGMRGTLNSASSQVRGLDA